MLIGCTATKGYRHPTTMNVMEDAFITAFNDEGKITLTNINRGGGGPSGLMGIRDEDQPNKRTKSADGTKKKPMKFVHDPEDYRTYFTWALK